ncbi:DNA repair protein RecN [Granulicatella sp. zg-ZJ]|uniref:DNA repair protein RecN n=1 Tax=Granulicatella sp. zg-ZJ TaxID=2678504 RepID=UPI0013CFF0E1|nr:DNA repair protein RecN [Granulicatella sp. zg-ZJ]NEW62807.1 DNA repair protein RecN [Granulicatella sp. zg-ZJ]
MLQTLSIQNFAIIEALTVDFSSGMTVLTGETGAGKSIIIDAVSLIVGARGSSEYIRFGQDKAILQGLFDIDNLIETQKMLEKHHIPYEDNQLMVYRELHKTGKNTIRINGILVTVSILKEIGSSLIDIHGQHEHQHLMDDTQHLFMLDVFGGQEVSKEMDRYRQLYQAYTSSRKTLKELMVSDKQDTNRISLLESQIKKIEKVNPKEYEDVQVEQTLKQIQEDVTRLRALTNVDMLLSDDNISVKELLSKAISELSLLGDAYHHVDTVLNDVYEQVQTVSKDIAKALEIIEYDEETVKAFDDRLNELDQLKQSFGKQTIDEVRAYYDAIKLELDTLLNKDSYLQKAQQTFLKDRELLLESATVLSTLRKEKAMILEQSIHTQLSDLYMDKVMFKVHFKEHQDKVKFKANGIDDIEFLIATNIGEPLKPLAKVASGGELSRMMLALKTIFTKTQGISTVIFDEIDTGVSGRVSQAIANKMSLIAHDTQVLCISHLPQVAAIADHHLVVKKEIVEDRTKTYVSLLTIEERIVEIARMIAGDDITDTALLHAKDLLHKK